MSGSVSGRMRTRATRRYLRSMHTMIGTRIEGVIHDAHAVKEGGGLEKTDDLIASLHQKHPKLRGPKLAKLYLLLRKDSPVIADHLLNCSSHTGIVGAHHAPRGDASSLTAATAALDISDAAGVPAALIAGLHSYFADLGEKPVCTLDALPLLSTLHTTPSSQAALIDPLTTNLNGASPPSPPDLSWLRRYITLQQWRLGCGSTLTMPLDDRYTLASTYNSLYSHPYPLSEDLDSRERGHADYLPSCATKSS